MINPTAYVSKQYWMRSELGLRGIELDIFAIIYGFTQNGNEHQISISYFREWLGVADSTVRKALTSLRYKRLIFTRNVKGKISFYSCNLQKVDEATKKANEKFGPKKNKNVAKEPLASELQSYDPFNQEEEEEEN